MLVGLDLPLVGKGTEAGGLIPTGGQLSESEKKHLRLRMKQLICGSLTRRLSCFFNDPADVGNLVSGSSAFSKHSLYT